MHRQSTYRRLRPEPRADGLVRDGGFTVAENLMIVAVAALLIIGVFSGFTGISNDVIALVRSVLSL